MNIRYVVKAFLWQFSSDGRSVQSSGLPPYRSCLCYPLQSVRWQKSAILSPLSPWPKKLKRHSIISGCCLRWRGLVKKTNQLSPKLWRMGKTPRTSTTPGWRTQWTSNIVASIAAAVKKDWWQSKSLPPRMASLLRLSSLVKESAQWAPKLFQQPRKRREWTAAATS